MSGEMSDICQFCELEWFEWVMFQNETALFPDDVLTLGCYLGPSIDVGPVMTANILMENGQVLHRSTYRPLTPEELLDRDGLDAREQFMSRVYERLGSRILPRELKDIGLEDTPQYDPYTFPQLMEELSPCQRWVSIT